ncbi:MAG: transposase [Hyphomicrobiales bacterium]|nr:transposase [Hyphomicrobiales bacterium]MCP5072114.1 transposase [Paracoccaceae bacterium]
MAKKRVRRPWSAEEKRSICLQTLAPGVSVAQVARRYAMNANLILKWLKDPRFQPDELEIEESAFLPCVTSHQHPTYISSTSQPEPYWIILGWTIQALTFWTNIPSVPIISGCETPPLF